MHRRVAPLGVRRKRLPRTLWRPALPDGDDVAARRLGAPTTRKRFGRRLARCGYGKELDDLGDKSLCELLQNGNGGIFETAFEAADIRSVDPGIRSKSFLR